MVVRQTDDPTRIQTGETMRHILFVFGQLTDDDVVWLTEAGAAKQLAAGTRLIEEGTAIQSIYFLLDGEARVTKAGHGPTDIARLRAGDMIGEMSFIDASLPSASVTTSVDSTVMEIPRHTLEHKLRADSGFASRFFRALAMLLSDRLRQTMDRFRSNEQKLSVNALTVDELDPNVLEAVTRAGERFKRMLKASQKSVPKHP